MPRELRIKLIKNSAGTISHVSIVDGIVVKPTAATLTITKPDGVTALPTPVAGDAATIAGSGKLTFTVVAANTATVDVGYKVVWLITVNSIIHERVEFFDVVKRIQDVFVTKEDIVLELPRLKNKDVGADWFDIITTSFNRMQEDLKNQGKETHLMHRMSDFYFAHIYKAIEMIALNSMEDIDDLWDNYQKIYAKKYTNELNNQVASIDVNEDATIQIDEDRKDSFASRLVR